MADVGERGVNEFDDPLDDLEFEVVVEILVIADFVEADKAQHAQHQHQADRVGDRRRGDVEGENQIHTANDRCHQQDTHQDDFGHNAFALGFDSADFVLQFGVVELPQLVNRLHKG